jgi:hypothetical protein
MENSSITLLITILGAFIGSLSAFLLSRKVDKTKLTLEFHKELYGPEMSRHRRIANDCIKCYPEADYSELQRVDKEKSISVLIIMRFYQRLWHCARTKQLNNQMAGDLFFDNFLYWYIVSYKDNLLNIKKGWTAAKEIPELYKWLSNHYSKTDETELTEENEKRKNEMKDEYQKKLLSGTPC